MNCGIGIDIELAARETRGPVVSMATTIGVVITTRPMVVLIVAKNRENRQSVYTNILNLQRASLQCTHSFSFSNVFN
jgi:hypothetical protein